MRHPLLLIPALLIAGWIGSSAPAGDTPAQIAIPTKPEVTALLAKGRTGHPRLFIADDTFAQAKQRAATDPRLALIIEAVIRQADGLLTRPVSARILEGRRLLGVSREAIRRITNLAAAWRLTGDARYAERAERELLAVCAFSDWNPSHFLDTAEMTMAVAIGYDWLFPALATSTRDLAHDAIIRLGIEPSLAGKQWWVSGTNNWCQVCHGGMMAGALAIHETIPELAATIVQRGIANLPGVMAASYAPDGAYPEGPGYWNYGTTFNVLAIEELRSVLGTDFSLPKAQGFLASADYMAHVHGPSGQPFAYADAGNHAPLIDPTRIWFIRETHGDWLLSPNRKAGDAGLANERFLAMILAWAPTSRPEATPPVLPLDFHGEGHKPVALFRSAWNDPKALWLGVSAGTPSSNHGHMDIGSFVFEADGVRWVQDLGMQSYESLESKHVDLWNSKQDSQRWSVFRIGNAGHSTLVIDGQRQQVKGFSSISAFSSTEPGCSVDLSPIYAGQAQAIERHFSLPERRKLVVTDHIAGLAKAGTVRWQIITPAAVTIAPDGLSARLAKDGRTCAVIVTSPAKARLVVGEAGPVAPYDAPNPGMSVLAAEVTAAAGETVDYRVELVPAWQ